MDITLERILSLIPKKPNGKYVHGSFAQFARSVGLSSGNLVSDWIAGRTNSYKNYLYEIAAKYDVSVEWLKGETDEKKPTTAKGDGLDDDKIKTILEAAGYSAEGADLLYQMAVVILSGGKANGSNKE